MQTIKDKPKKTKQRSYIVTPTMDIREAVPENFLDFKLGELYTLLECNEIETARPVPTLPGYMFILDAYGKQKGKPKNPIASALWQVGAEPGSPRAQDDIVGTVLLCPISSVK